MLWSLQFSLKTCNKLHRLLYHRAIFCLDRRIILEWNMKFWLCLANHLKHLKGRERSVKALYELLIARSIHVSTIFQKEQLNLFKKYFLFLSNVFIYFWLCGVFTVHAFSSCGVQASHCSGFSCCSARELQQLRCTGLAALRYVEASWTRDWTPVPCIGRQFLTTGPPGKSTLKQIFRKKLRWTRYSLRLLYCAFHSLSAISWLQPWN